MYVQSRDKLFRARLPDPKNCLFSSIRLVNLLTPACFQELADRLPDAHSGRFLLKASGFREPISASSPWGVPPKKIKIKNPSVCFTGRNFPHQIVFGN